MDRAHAARAALVLRAEIGLLRLRDAFLVELLFGHLGFALLARRLLLGRLELGLRASESSRRVDGVQVTNAVKAKVICALSSLVGASGHSRTFLSIERCPRIDDCAIRARPRRSLQIRFHSALRIEG